jgi:protein-L-isoaspartate O-methyltransferase
MGKPTERDIEVARQKVLNLGAAMGYYESEKYRAILEALPAWERKVRVDSVEMCRRHLKKAQDRLEKLQPK